MGVWIVLEELVFTTEDYDDFDQRYDFNTSSVNFLFVHNPIVFLGYVNDTNIKNSKYTF